MCKEEEEESQEENSKSLLVLPREAGVPEDWKLEEGLRKGHDCSSRMTAVGRMGFS